jgi:hypothetical protein
MKHGFLKRPKSRNWKNGHAKARKTGLARTTKIERIDAEEYVPAYVADNSKSKKYLAANCVVLAAAIFAKPWAKQWAEDLLPAARSLDGRERGL